MSIDTGTYRTTLDKLGRLVVSGAVSPGHVLQTQHLIEQFLASRTVIREAVRVLESMGMVQSRRRVGVIVNPRDRWDVFDPLLVRWRLEGPDRQTQLRSFTELRMGFEPVAAALATQRATPAQRRVITDAVMDMAVHGRTGNLQAYLEADIVFHTTLLAASGNEMFTALHTFVAEVLVGRTRHGLMPAPPSPDTVRLHADVAQAVDFHDRTAAERAMREILVGADRAMLAQITSDDDGSGAMGR